jgi:hypothetical protein
VKFILSRFGIQEETLNERRGTLLDNFDLVIVIQNSPYFIAIVTFKDAFE